MKKIKKVLLLLLAVVFAVSCGSKGESKNESNTNAANLAGSIKIDGSSTVYPITEAVAEEFQNEFPKVQVTIGVSGTGGGFKKFGRGETDISNASRLIKDAEAQDCKANQIDFIGLDVAFDGIVIVVNPKNDWIKDIKVEELKRLWEPEAQGKILKWSQIRPEWPDKEIHLFGAGTASGTYDYFTEAIVGKSGSSRGDFTASEDDNVLVQGIKGDELALGFFGLAYYEENKESLKLVPVDNGAGAVLPTREAVISNAYAPLSRPVFIYVSKASAKRPEVVEFVNYYLDIAKEIAAEVGYVPMPDATYTEQKNKFSAFASGPEITK